MVGLEINNLVKGALVDDIITDFPGTASSYKRNRCLHKDNYNIPLLQPGFLLSFMDPEYLPPTMAPYPTHTFKDVIESPMSTLTSHAPLTSSPNQPSSSTQHLPSFLLIFINNLVKGALVDDNITDFPGTTMSYKRNRCLHKDNYNIPLFQLGFLLSFMDPGYLPQTMAPYPTLTFKDVIESPMSIPTSHAPPALVSSSPNQPSSTTQHLSSFLLIFRVSLHKNDVSKIGPDSV
ncbi:hypothetical protein ZOSMA_3G00090 [Zostera marina]|uniref:glycerophosphodiester phosphodiesterase n=1 Tax=Zostera marina TaxID=29655 RepID=A0A0K9P3H3_ZOSMR|nr:hypothetical protein ZOSMA_3G00090 [Zostera marina]